MTVPPQLTINSCAEIFVLVNHLHFIVVDDSATNQLVEGLKCSEVINSNFLSIGCGDTDDESEADHDMNVKAFLKRVR